MASLATSRIIGIFAIVAALLLIQHATPSLAADEHGYDSSQVRLLGVDDDGNDEAEAVYTRLNFSSSAPHLFHSTFSLLQQLPNTVFPNGHTMAPVEMPPLTLFHHARRDADAPSSPEWVAFDSEMSYGIMGGHRNVWMRTYQSTRPIRALYFDGESGNLQGLGQFDTQMLLLFGNVTGAANETRDDLELEYVRAQGLCSWLEDAGLRGPHGFEGIVRMNAGFEMIWCDFESDGLRLMSKINVTAPRLPGKGDQTAVNWAPSATPRLPELPPGWKKELQAEPFLRTRSWGWSRPGGSFR